MVPALVRETDQHQEGGEREKSVEYFLVAVSFGKMGGFVFGGVCCEGNQEQQNGGITEYWIEGNGFIFQQHSHCNC
jgi:hypothetical protein